MLMTDGVLETRFFFYADPYNQAYNKYSIQPGFLMV